MKIIQFFLLTFIFFSASAKPDFVMSCGIEIAGSQVKVNGFAGMKLFDSVALGTLHDGSTIYLRAVPWYDASFEKKSQLAKGLAFALPVLINRSFDYMSAEHRRIKKLCEPAQPVMRDTDAHVNSLLENSENFLEAAKLGILDAQQKNALADELYRQLNEEKKSCRKEHIVKKLEVAIHNVAVYRGIQ